MYEANIVILRGHITSEPRVRELPSGSRLTQLEVTTRSDSSADSVPVVLFDRSFDGGADDEVVVAGHVRRRFFRAGGSTQSRTEVVAVDVVRVSRRATAEKLVARAVSLVAV